MKVEFDKKPLVSSKHGDTNEHTIVVMGGDPFLWMKKTLMEAYVAVKSGKKTIREKKCKNVELSNN